MEADFSGYVTKANIRCKDGRVISPSAFKHMDGMQVPLVWQHGHSSAENVLGHVRLEARDNGVYGYGYFNDTRQGKNAKQLVQHKDINAMSIFANDLVEKAKSVLHGMIREVSLVLAGANPGALIDFIRVAHGDGDIEVMSDEAVIYTGLFLEHGASSDSGNDGDDEDDEDDVVVSHADADATVKDIYDSLDEDQKTVVHFLIGAALESVNGSEDQNDDSAAQSDNDSNNLSHEEKDGNNQMTHNIFENNGTTKTGPNRHALTHDDVKGIVANAVKTGSLKGAVEDYALQHGIEDIDLLFPDAKTLSDRPEFNQRRTEWVQRVLGATHHSPFSRVKTIVADITQDEARAKGYIKGSYKREEWIGLQRRITGPTTIYKKQKLDREDVINITDFDVIVWLKQELRVMLEEELARAILISDGRDVLHEDKVKEPAAGTDGAGIRSIANDHELFVTTLNVNIDDEDSTYEEVIEVIMRGMEFYKGTGTPDFYTTYKTLNGMLLTKDAQGRRLYRTRQEVAEALGVREIHTVEPMSEVDGLLGIVVNLQDYNIGTDKGGETNMFDDFDIDYNQYKYLLETHLSGALTKVKSALVVRSVDAASVLVAPVRPTFVSSTGVVTIPSVTGVIYKNADGDGTISAGAMDALDPGESITVYAVPDTNYYFENNAQDEWKFKRPAS